MTTPDLHGAARHRSPTYATACQIVAALATELPRTRTEASWLNLIEADLPGYLAAVSCRRTDDYALAARTRRFSARLLDTLGLTRRLDRNRRVWRKGLNQARAVAVLHFVECRVVLLCQRHGAAPEQVAALAALLLGMWHGHRLMGLFAGVDSDRIGELDFEPLTGVIGNGQLRTYHQQHPM